MGHFVSNQRDRKRGTALVLAILVSVVLTGLVIALSLVAGTQNLAASNTIRRNAAFYAAEAGAQQAYWNFKNNSAYRKSAGSPLTGSLTMGNGVYNYSVTVIGSGSTVQIVSVGTLSTINSVTPTGAAVSATYQLSAVSNSYVPALYTNNVLDDSAKAGTWAGPINVVGDVYVQNDINMAGKQGLSVTGNVVYGGKETGTALTVSGTNTAGTPSVTTPNYSTIEAHAVNPQGTAASPNMTIDFTAIPGSNPTYYVTGNLTDPTFIGSGTVIVDGAGAGVTFDTKTISIGTASQPVYIVTAAAGIIQIGDPKGATTSCTIYGGIYSGKDWNTTCSINMFGPIEVVGNTNYTGTATTSTITKGPTGWFDATPPTSSGTVTSSNIGGAIP